MHPSAMINGEKFFKKYCSEKISEKKVLDVGSYDVNGTLRPIFFGAHYVGLDMMEGPGVDLIGSSHEIPFEQEYFDIVVSTSCFEHDDMFWISFLEMLRVLKTGGFMYINAPSNGFYHGHPGDNWRFYADSWKALEKWGLKNGTNVKLIESYISDSLTGFQDCEENFDGLLSWKDSVGIFTKF